MSNQLQIKAVMHPFPHSIGVDQSLQTAKDMLAEHNIRHLPVQKGGELVGVLTERDIHFVLSVEESEASKIVVANCYTEEPYAVEPSALVSSVARRMSEDHLGCALVVENGSLIGIFTTVDACRTLCHCLSGSLDT